MWMFFENEYENEDIFREVRRELGLVNKENSPVSFWISFRFTTSVIFTLWSPSLPLAWHLYI
jgi:hypothetical protein